MYLRRATILPYFSILLIGLFLIGATPRQFIHDMCEDHEHASITHLGDEDVQLNASDYHCGYNTPIATFPYLPTAAIHFISYTFLYDDLSIADLSTLVEREIELAVLRGPPSVV